MSREIGDAEISRATAWNWGDNILLIENPRHPFTEPFQKIVGQAMETYVQPGSLIVGIGAGAGYLKELLPVEYQDGLLSTDYNIANLQASPHQRSLRAISALAYELPFRDSAVDAVINLDAFDTFASFDKAFSEVSRVLKPGGVFMHFQANNPAEDMLEIDHPDLVWLPQPQDADFSRREQAMAGGFLVGVCGGSARLMILPGKLR